MGEGGKSGTRVPLLPARRGKKGRALLKGWNKMNSSQRRGQVGD